MKLTPLRTISVVVGLLAAAILVFSHFTPKTRSNTVAVGAAPTSTSPGESGSAEPEPTVSVDHAGDDGADDGSPILVQPTREPDAKEAATAFAAAWCNTYGRTAEAWRAGLLDKVTDDLAAGLVAADPKSVPAAAKAAAVTVTRQGSILDATAAIVTAEPKPRPIGTLILTMLETDGRWLVSEIDWRPVR